MCRFNDIDSPVIPTEQPDYLLMAGCGIVHENLSFHVSRTTERLGDPSSVYNHISRGC